MTGLTELVRGRVNIGDFELTVLTDGSYYLDGGAMFGVVPKPLWEKRTQADAQNRVLLGLNTVVIRDGKHTVVVETGIGNKLTPKAREIYQSKALLPSSFAAAGISLEEVDVVINSHLHFDHCGWNTTALQGDSVIPTFPNARYYAHRGEIMHGRLQLERDAISYMADNYEPLIATGQMTLLEGPQEILPCISVDIFPGQHRTDDGRERDIRRMHRKLYLRSDPHQRSPRSNLGHGIRSRPAHGHRTTQTLLCACYPGALAGPVYSRSRHALWVRRIKRKE